MKSYVCVLSTDNYLEGVLFLNENLKNICSRYSLLCIINEKISIETRNILSFFNIEIKEIKSITYEDYSDNIEYGEYGINKGYLKNTFDKLNIFSLTEYEKLVYLDCDLLILRNIDYLFNCPHLSCPVDLPFDDSKYNSGIMVLKPNMDDFNSLKKATFIANKQGREISDQDIINEYFEKIIPIEYGHNMVREISGIGIFSYYDEIKKKDILKRRVIRFLEDSEYNTIIHYIGKLKPFMTSDYYDDIYYHLYQYYLSNVRREENIYYSNNEKMSD